MDRLKSIVVGLDFSKHSENALAQAMRIAHWNRAKLHLIHVIQHMMVTDWAETYDVPEANLCDDLRNAMQKQAGEVLVAARNLDAQASDASLPSVDTDVEVVIGNPFAYLLSRVRDLSADLLVLGSNGSSDPARGPGGLATKCVRKAPTKVMLVRESTPEPFKRVVACVDFSDTSRLVVEQALRIARQDRATVDLLHAYQPPPGALHYMPPARQAASDLEQRYIDQCERRLRGFIEAFEPETRDLEAHTHLAGGLDEKQEIVRFVSSRSADLVILGTRGRTELTGILIGTTAERIVRDAPCSVLAIKPEGFDYEVH